MGLNYFFFAGPGHTRIFFQPRRTTVSSPNDIYYRG